MLWIIFTLFSLSSACLISINQVEGSDNPSCLIGSIPCKSISYPLIHSPCDLVLVADHTGEIDITINRDVKIHSQGFSVIGSNFIANDGTIIFSNMTMISCPHTCLAIWEIKRMNLNNMIFRDTVSPISGSVITVYRRGKSHITIRNCTFQNNTSGYAGGVMTLNNPFTTFIIDECRFLNNHAVKGGALYLDTARVFIINSVFDGNTATKSGGAIYNAIADFSAFANLTFINNSADSGGAIIDIANGDYYNISFINNTAHNSGGALSLIGSRSLFHNISIFNNTAGNKGGGIVINGYGSYIYVVCLKDVIIQYNNASIGPGIYCENTSLIMNNNTIRDKTSMNNCDRLAPASEKSLYDYRTYKIIFFSIFMVMVFCAATFITIRVIRSQRQKEYTPLLEE